METDSNNLQEPLLQNEVAMEGADWRNALQQEERERIANEMLETLKRNIPLLRQEDLQSFKKIAARFEETIYTEATSQSDYLRRVSLKMTKMNAYSMNSKVNSLQSNAASNSEDAQDPASQSMQSQIQDQVQQLPTAMVSDQSLVQCQNIQDNIALTGEPNSAGSAPAQPPVDGKSKDTVPGIPVQNLNSQIMSNEAPFAVRNQMNLLLPNQQIQHLLGLQLKANTLRGDTQQRIQLSMLQPQTSSDQQKQSSKSQGNMPAFKLASQSVQSQVQNQVQQLPTARVSNQSQVQSQNIPYSIASTGVPNSAASAPAEPPVNGKSKSTMPSVPVQNPKAQNKSTETPSAVRNPMMQGRSTNSMVEFGQQQVVSQSITQSHIQQLLLMQQQLQQRNLLQRWTNRLPNAIVSEQSQVQQQQRMNLLQLNQAMQQNQLGLKQEANSLPGNTQQRIQSTAPMFQPQTTIDQKKQLSQSQGNMPDFKLGVNMDSAKKAVTAIKKRHRSPVSSLQRGKLTQNMLSMQQSQQQQPQIPPNEDQMDSQIQQINIQGPAMPTQPNNLTELQQSILSSGSDVSNSCQNMLGGRLHPGLNVDPGQGNVLNQTQEVARNSMQQNPVGGSQQMNSSVSPPKGLFASQSNSNVVQLQKGNALNEAQEIAVNPLQQNPLGCSVSSQDGPTALKSNSNVVPPQQIQMLSDQLLHANQVQKQMLEQYMATLSMQQEQFQLKMQQQLFQHQQWQQKQQQSIQQQQEQIFLKQSARLPFQQKQEQTSQNQQQSIYQQPQQQEQTFLKQSERRPFQQKQEQTSPMQSARRPFQQQQGQTSQKLSARRPIQQQQQTSQKQSAAQPIQQQQKQTSQKQSGQQMTPETAQTAVVVLLVTLVVLHLMMTFLFT